MITEHSFPAGAVVVIFTSVLSNDGDGYEAMASRMEALAAQQPGYLGMTSARNPESGLGITVSYWRDEAAARDWKQVAEHREAQAQGRQRWYAGYRVEVCEIRRSYQKP